MVIDGNFSIVDGLTGDKTALGKYGYVEIPPYRPYQLVPATNSTPSLVSFDVPSFSVLDFAYPPCSGSEDGSKPFDTLSLSEITHLDYDAITTRPLSWNDTTDVGWSLIKTKLVRVNFSIWNPRAKLANHYHPDADHSLVLLTGRARVITPDEESVLEEGDYVSIPKDVPHYYEVLDVDYGRTDQHAVFISFDAPPYHSAKTVYL